MAMTYPGRVLSIQSHVVSGSVGNKSAIFPLQALGWDVDPVHTVQLSNHKGYPKWKGMHMSAEHFSELFDAMDENALLDRDTHLLTGYIPDAESLKVITELVPRLRQLKPNLVYVLDPVMGDDGRVYVNPNVIPLYMKLVSMADVITPNDFEVSLLTDIKINSLETLCKAIDELHTRYSVPNVIVSSVCFKDDPEKLVCAGSCMTTGRKFTITFPRLNPHFEGVGDVFSALVLAHYRPESSSSSSSGITGLGRAAYLALCSLRGILLRTEAAANEATKGEIIDLSDPKFNNREETREERTRRLAAVELKLVQSWQEIRQPPADPEVVFRWLS